MPAMVAKAAVGPGESRSPCRTTSGRSGAIRWGDELGVLDEVWWLEVRARRGMMTLAVGQLHVPSHQDPNSCSLPRVGALERDRAGPWPLEHQVDEAGQRHVGVVAAPSPFAPAQVHALCGRAGRPWWRWSTAASRMATPLRNSRHLVPPWRSSRLVSEPGRSGQSELEDEAGRDDSRRTPSFIASGRGRRCTPRVPAVVLVCPACSRR